MVKTSERALYYVLGNGKAMRYPVGVGRAGKQWSGTARISGKYLKPAWSPPEEVKRDKPSLPNVILGGSPWFGRRLRLVWLHSHVQCGRARSLQPRQLGRAGGRDPLRIARCGRGVW